MSNFDDAVKGISGVGPMGGSTVPGSGFGGFTKPMYEWDGVRIDQKEYNFRMALAAARYPYYVSMTDKFFTNVGLAPGRIAKYIYGCISREQADIVAQNAINRGDQKNVSIGTTKPSFSARKYHVEFFGPGDRSNSRWYLAPWNGGFQPKGRYANQE